MEQSTKLSIEEAQPPAFISQTGKIYWTKQNLQARVEQIHATHVVIRLQGQYKHCGHNGVMLGFDDVINEEVPEKDVTFGYL